MDIKEKWLNVIKKYSLIKELFIECEETDPELKTNLQPLNEFRAALDHIMKIMGSYYMINSQSDQNQDDLKKEVDIQFEKLNSHLNRCFYDVCDMLSINIRNKIIDILELYSSDDIAKAIPNYYSEIKPHIEKICQNIAKYRNEKGNYGIDSSNRFEEYKNDILKLKLYYNSILEKMCSLDEISSEGKKINRKNHTINVIIGIISGILVFVFTEVAKLLFFT